MSSHVVRGRQGWLFLGEGSSRSMSQVTGAVTVEPVVRKQWARAIQVRREVFGDRTATVVCPEKACVYPHLLPEGWELSRGRFARALARQHESVLYPFVDLGRAGTADLYWPTDTHFTQYGAHRAARLLCDHLGIHYEPLDVEWQPRSELGDLGVALEPQERSDNLVMAAPPPLRTTSNGLRNRGRVARYTSRRGGSTHVLVFGDSFSGIGLAPQLAHLVGTVTFVHSPAFDYELALRLQPDYVVGEVAERFLVEPPGEGRSLVSLLLEKHVQGLYSPEMVEQFRRTLPDFADVYGPGTSLLDRHLGG